MRKKKEASMVKQTTRQSNTAVKKNELPQVILYIEIHEINACVCAVVLCGIQYNNSLQSCAV